ncbi:Wadjet anti-phage system protein JetD domain-containing protein [Propionibacteriaceae bacterium Y1685]|uniref:Wadjet anti-phage system protein JetD domain-containing protein n=1 Tax=Microlunatus sp. Y1700 TaxID=3418487 RepID=UPI003D5BEBE9
MKATDEVVAAIERRLNRTWHLTLGGDEAHWPHRVPLGKPTSKALAGDFAVAQQWALEWQDWASTKGLEVAHQSRRVGGTEQQWPSHVVVPDVGTAARVVGAGWPDRLKRGRQRLSLLRTRFPAHPEPSRLVRATASYKDVDFDLLLTAANWFQNHEASGLSPRQVPIEGLHSKWLNNHQSHVVDLAQVPDLGLVEVRPHAVHFTYLDPTHRASGRRVHDCVYPGFPMQPEYVPRTVVITENKDTSVLFPTIEAGISVQGHGNAGPSLISRVAWLKAASHVVYWGDLDAKGMEIVNDYRRYGMPVETILMDESTAARFAQFRAETDERGVPLKRSARKPLKYLTEAERRVYETLTDPTRNHPVRIEQERIPLDEAVAALRRLGVPGLLYAGSD